jgi:hypothetical protein
MIFLWQPLDEVPIFSFRGTILDKISYLFVAVGSVEYLLTVPFFMKTDLLGLNRMMAILNFSEIEYPFIVQIEAPWIYKLCRHPMQGGTLLIILFSSTDFNLGRVICVTLLVLGQYIGVMQEEKFLGQYEGYRKFKSVVKNMYIPQFSNLFDDNVTKALKID